MITPNIDKLAYEGVQFNNAFTNIAVCGASRASLMILIRPSGKRFNDFSTRAAKDVPNAISLNELLKTMDMKQFPMVKFIITMMILVSIGQRLVKERSKLIFKIQRLLR